MCQVICITDNNHIETIQACITIESIHFIISPLLTKHDNLKLPIGGNNITSLSRLDLLIQRATELDAGSGRLMSISSCALVPSMAFKVVYLISKVSCLDAVTGHLKGVIDELELGMEVVPLTLEAAVLVIESTIAFNLRKRVPTLLVCHCFMKCVGGRGQAREEIVEPGGYWVSSI